VDDTKGFVLEDKQAELARSFIEERLRSRGYTLKKICELPEEEARRIMVDASIYASVKLAEVEDKAHFVHSIQGTS
jgi:broad-specificity NMP kinase